MEGAGKLIDDDELREAMAEKGLGTPATRAAIIEGLIAEKYMLRDGRELVPTAKAFQLMTLLRGLGDRGPDQARADRQLGVPARRRWSTAGSSASAFMAEIAKMAERIVQARPRSTTATRSPATTRRWPRRARTAAAWSRRTTAASPAPARDGDGEGCGFSHHQDPGRPQPSRLAEAEAFLRDKKIGPLEGFRSKAGWPFTAELKLVRDDEIGNWKLEFDFGDDAKAADGDGEPVDFSGQQSLGACPKCQGHVYEHGSSYVCEHAVGAHVDLRLQERQDHPAAAGGARADDASCWPTGKTALLRELRLQQDAAQVQGLPGLRREGRQGRLRVRAAAPAQGRRRRRRRRKQDRGVSASGDARRA
ncbi:MAG: topoisomerase C-terminal repeat-containing protein [Comamonadaceae bacterium]|nr:topoisomerase C-terminal repeat-containing protein [Comamonadaceae bacterium]